MNRKDFLKTSGLIGLGLAVGNKPAQAVEPKTDCVLIPRETAGPFPLDLTDNNFFLRQNVIEDREGTPFKMKMRIIGNENCEPMQNVRVHIWQCDKDGNYSGYDTGSNPGQDGLTYLRGYQVTDSNGEVEFTSIFPGIYPGRICHIHFQVYVNSNYSAISQLTFDEAAKDQLYFENQEIYGLSQDPLRVNQDGAFVDGYELQLASLEKNQETGEWESFLEVTVEGSGVTSIDHQSRQALKHVELFQNYPNPFDSKTTIPYELKGSSNVKIEIWDINGNKIHSIDRGYQNEGKYFTEINLSDLNLSRSKYIYQIIVQNNEGRFVTNKLMTGR